VNYTVSQHAIDRAFMRYGISPEDCREWVNGLMAEAKYINTNGDRSTYRNGDKLIVVDIYTNNVITIAPIAADNGVREKVQKILDREIKKSEREYKRAKRKLDIKVAELSVEMAQLSLNKAKARNPKIQSLIDEKINAIERKITELNRKIREITDEYKTKEKTIKALRVK
jgi:hypothetical protein